ncbi:diguanylate cyclase [Tamilnaduibacter salinus]|uniref:diguanylate cyclase n=1 Tax=Tamilnaduibacter salinus TaxID=1484056 RepID=UPI00130466CD|nr:diguanylate cyclase [Tamilnaduibacter salinus]
MTLVLLSQIQGLFQRFLNTLSHNIKLENNQQVSVGASIGIALFPNHSTDINPLIDMADRAMYHIKHSGKNGYFVHILRNNA